MNRITRQMPTGELTLKVDEARFPLNWLIGFAARANAKRGFLFLSKVLGKHWPVTPRAMDMIHADLAGQIPPSLPGPVVFIAMAETAIGLGQGVFEAYLREHPERQALFLHSSRYRVGDVPFFEFEESHSHAPRQFLQLSERAAALFAQARSLVLVDDEASTGNTFVNLAAVCRARNPNIERIHLAVITNFMGEPANAGLTPRFGVPTTVGATLSGHYRFAPGAAAAPAAAPAQRFEADAERGASAAFGRIGVERALAAPQALAARLGKDIGEGESVLVLGTGEFMHPAFLLARELEALGKRVLVQSTTRSPILSWGAVGHIVSCPDNYGEGIANYLYNVAPGQYRHVFICHETPPGEALNQLAGQLDGRLFHFQSETQIEEISVRRP
ncbi:phosphoribosyltransferase domain-containing protein [Janthinobacterium fluminis]|uniref:Phosphoribosyltransferase domain-containing protein n=1 Tax=Janthinobacterium fluminis TaxID=2987524 RepID=A0ABT5K6A3_9BURK|nr:phosphoribosyltransferase domain-containing protein [Janthinobacterium fluminis]MDC8760532.1 phosphoribosyltransferase domain-containing protein [Janthinobacterium fluminis]